MSVAPQAGYAAKKRSDHVVGAIRPSLLLAPDSPRPRPDRAPLPTATTKGASLDRSATAALRAGPQRRITNADMEAWVNGDPAAEAPGGGPLGTGPVLGGAASERTATDAVARRGPRHKVKRSVCAEIEDAEGDGSGDVTMRACAGREKKKSWRGGGRKHYAVTTKAWASGHGEVDSGGDCSWNCDKITGVYAMDYYHYNSKFSAPRVAWYPLSTETIEDSCQTVGGSSTYRGTTVSTDSKVCPDKYGFWNNGHGSSGYYHGGFWKGGGTTRTRGFTWNNVRDYNMKRRSRTFLKLVVYAKIRWT